MNTPQFVRPSFSEAMSAWTAQLQQRGYPTDLIRVFDENLCFERQPDAPGGFRLGYQIMFTPPPPEAAQLAFDYFSEFDARLVFYRIGSSGGKSVCLLLCDQWFETKKETDGFVRRDEWRISLRPGPSDEIEGITDRERWSHRLIRDRPLHDLDFCMTLTGIHEILAHDRVLTTYERYALKFLHAWRRLLGQHR